MASPRKPKENKPAEGAGMALGMCLRVYPTRAQAGRLGGWIHTAHRFRNEAVAFTQARRRQRGEWLKANPGQGADAIPDHLTGNDVAACSRWLTGRLEAARKRLALETGAAFPKAQAMEAFSRLAPLLSRGEKDAIEDAWLLAVPRTALDQVLQDLGRTIERAWSDRKKTKGRNNKALAQFPVFHKWRHAGSVRLQVVAGKNQAFRDHWAAGEVFVPGLGRLRFRDKSALPATPPKLITVSRNSAGQYHVGFLCAPGQAKNAHRLAKACSMPLAVDPATGLPVVKAIDLGRRQLTTDADGNTTARMDYLRRQLRKLRRQGKSLSRKKKGSGRWKKAQRQLGRTHARIANQRAARVLEVAQGALEGVAILCIEDLFTAAMNQGRNMGRGAADAPFGQFVRTIEHEAGKRGVLVLKCGRFDPSSKTCSGCGAIHAQLKRNDTTWDCPGCGVHHDRDTNAAINIRVMALKRALVYPDFSSVPENGARVLPSLPVHPDLAAFIARGGLTALLELYSSESRRQGDLPGQQGAHETRISPGQPPVACREHATGG